MLKVEYQKWNMTVDALRQQMVSSPHPRTRERFAALYDVAYGKCATDVAQCTGRRPDTVHGWIHRFNRGGVQAVVYRHTGGRQAMDKDIQQALNNLLNDYEPGKPVMWTLRKLKDWLAREHGVHRCRETIRKVLRSLGHSWKKAKKLLNKACPTKRAEFVDKLLPLLEQAATDKRVLIFMDPAHIHQDCDLGYGWAPVGQRLWVSSSSPGLSQKVTFYGSYIYNDATVRIWDYDRANSQNTIDALRRLRKEFEGRPITIFWDGASYHRAKVVKAEVKKLGMELEPLPGYSPDFMPVEELWRWFRSEVTNAHVHETKDDLLARAAQFEQDINQEPYRVADRLVVKTTLDPEVEKLRFST